MTGTTAAISAGLVLLAVLDGSLAGFRSACGRSALIDRRDLDRRACVGGAITGIALVACLGAWFGGLMACVDDPRSCLEALSRGGAWALAAYASLAVVALMALIAYLLAPLRWRSLSMVATLGPLTLARPVVLVMGAVAAAWTAPEPTVWLSAAVVVTAVAVETAAIDRWVRAEVRRFDPMAPGEAEPLGEASGPSGPAAKPPESGQYGMFAFRGASRGGKTDSGCPPYWRAY